MPRKATTKKKTKPITPHPLTKAMGNLAKAKLDGLKVALDLSDYKPHIPTGALAIDYLIGGRPNQFGVALVFVPKGSYQEPLRL